MAFQTVDDLVDSEVRELIRRRGVDPLTEPVRVRELIDEVLSDYADRALSSPLPPLGDPTSLAKRLHDGVAGFGPLQALLDDPEVEEVWINQPVKTDLIYLSWEMVTGSTPALVATPRNPV